MKNKVKTVVFPLTKNYSSYGHDQYNDNPINVLYVSTPLDTLKKAATLARKHGLGIQANHDISVRPVTNSIFIGPRTIHHTSDWAELFVPELYSLIDYEWLLEQVKVIKKGAMYTEACLLQSNELVVFNGETYSSRNIPNVLIKELSETVSSMFTCRGVFTGITPNVWSYFTDLISISRKGLYRAELSDKAKKLIVDMKLQGIQNTTVYYILQAISDIVDDLQQKRVRKLP